MDDDKRDSVRVTIPGALQAEIRVFEPMLIKEIGRGGVTVETRFPLQLDSLHDLRLALGDRSVVVKGRVIHSRISNVDQDIVTYRTGIEFIEPSTPVTTVIAEFLDEMNDEMKAPGTEPQP